MKNQGTIKAVVSLLVFISGFGSGCERTVNPDETKWTCDDTQFALCKKVDQCLNELKQAGVTLKEGQCYELGNKFGICNGITGDELKSSITCVVTLKKADCDQVKPLAQKGAVIPEYCETLFKRVRQKTNLGK